MPPFSQETTTCNLCLEQHRSLKLKLVCVYSRTYFFCIGGGARRWRRTRPDSGASLLACGTEPVVSPSVQVSWLQCNSGHIVSACFPVLH
ncbi:hypothetical protein EYF80_064262 [Liparis tanakae]|uniref:Uncharacterized protein n=1 Tax=Liparis tanakae TaxID=230148 RepID=A0A4Z2E9R3_9TELE|nr:hypothetical protein EYF80_064262 [Liparis tanakae]